MWLITPDGFFSIVEKQSDKQSDTLTVRSRVKSDLDALRASTLPELGPTVEGTGTDYRYRAVAPRDAVARALTQMVEQLRYSNFKNEVTKRQGRKRAELYHEVWDVLYQLQTNPSDFKAAGQGDREVAHPVVTAAPKADAYGGLVINDQQQILMVEPLNHFGGYVWTFPKGRPDSGETPGAAAIREVREETGWNAEIVAALPQLFAGSTTSNAYFLMRPVGTPGPFNSDETQSIRWVSLDEAQTLVQMTKIETGRQRDLAVLEAVRVAMQHRGDGRAAKLG